MKFLEILGIIFLIGIGFASVVSTPSQFFAGDGIEFNSTVSLDDTIEHNESITKNVTFFNNVTILGFLTGGSPVKILNSLDIIGNITCFDVIGGSPVACNITTSTQANITSNINMNLFNITNITALGVLGDNNTISISPFGTGNTISGDTDLRVGTTNYGIVRIGAFELAHLDGMGVIGGTDLNASRISFFQSLNNENNITFLFAGSGDTRFVIAKPGLGLASYFPRSLMVGGNTGVTLTNNMTHCDLQGYDKIDCNTDATGADLGIQDDLQVGDDVQVGGTVNATTLNHTYGQMYFIDETLVTTVIVTPGVFVNVTGINTSRTSRMNFTANNKLEVLETGVYHITFGISMSDGANKQFGLSVGVGGVNNHNNGCISHRQMGTTGDLGSMSSSCILHINSGQVVSLMIEGESTPISNAELHDASITLIKIGE